ncbi:MAG: ABC transporter permease [Chthoniobacterales bacterium]
MSVEASEVLEVAATKRRARLGMLFNLTLVILLVLLWVTLAFTTKNFFTHINIPNLLRQGSMIAILAMGETFVIITAGIDLSVGAVAAFCTVITALLFKQSYPIPAVVLIVLVVGFIIGSFHAFGITKLGLPPFIMTLATMTVLRGLGLILTGGSTVSIDNTAFTSFSYGDLGAIWLPGLGFLPLPNLFWMVLLVGIPAYVFLHHSRFGRYLFAVGSNTEAARLSGVNTRFMIYLAYILSAMTAAFVGVLLASRIGIGMATQAEGWELQAIASSVIGGTSLFGAIGSVHGPLLGAFILATINNGCNLLNVNSYWQLVITGFLIIVIVYFDGLRRKSA